MINRKLLALFLALLTVLAMLGGCDTEEGTYDDDVDSQTQAFDFDDDAEIGSNTETETETQASTSENSSDTNEDTVESETQTSIVGSESDSLQSDTESEKQTVDSETETSSSTEGCDTTPVYDYEPVEGIPPYSGKPYVILNNNVPNFTDADKVTTSYELYSDLDSLGRCGYAMACVGKDIMPTEDRESISSVKPSGWINKKYDTSLVDGGYIYNRCHLIGFQLTGENANKYNLITGTRYMNVEGMLPFENMIADFVKETGNHVIYRVTPIFVGNNLVASGVQLEAFSVEDNGEDVCFNVFVYNVQPGITIDYATGDSQLSSEKPSTSTETDEENGTEQLTEVIDGEVNQYVLNTNTKKIHRPECSYASDIKEHNRSEYEGKLQDLLDDGYTACKSCDPT